MPWCTGSDLGQAQAEVAGCVQGTRAGTARSGGAARSEAACRRPECGKQQGVAAVTVSDVAVVSEQRCAPLRRPVMLVEGGDFPRRALLDGSDGSKHAAVHIDEAQAAAVERG